MPDSHMNQREEIETIKPRTIMIPLSDADCSLLMDICGEYGLTVGELFAAFAGDLICGTYTNGSDERMLANKWFDRCCFDYRSGNSLLRHLLSHWFKPEVFFDMIGSLSSAYEELEFLRSHPEECELNDIPYTEGFIYRWQEDFHEYIRGWEPEGDSDLFEEVQNIAEWIDFKHILLSGCESDSLCSDLLQEIRVEEVFSRCSWNPGGGSS